MTDYVRPSIVRKAAKQHRCTYCGEAIPQGELHREQTGFWDGAAFRNRFHDECYQELSAEGEGEFTPYSHERPEKETA
jgi:ribosomal protein L37AE/L43A